MAAIGDKEIGVVPNTSILDAYLGWLAQWQRAVFFPGTGRTVEAPPAMLGFSGDAARILEPNAAVDSLVEAEAELHRLSGGILAAAQLGNPISSSDFDRVMASFTRLITGLVRHEQSTALAQSGVDQLTGLRNRAVMFDELLREANRFYRNGQPFSIVVCDLDRFEPVKESHGREAGDSVLKAVTAAIQSSLRSFDDAFRVGGDEFVVCLKDCDLLDAAVVAERIRRNIEQQKTVLADGRTIRVTASVGIVGAGVGRGIEDLLEQAERALSRAKQGGGNQVAQADLADNGLGGVIDMSEGTLV